MFFPFLLSSSLSDPRPPRPTGPSLPLNFTPSLPSFNLQGINPPDLVQFVWYGYSVRLQISNITYYIVEGAPTTLSGVTISLHPTFLRPHVLLLAFKLQNRNPTATVASVAVEGDILFDALDRAPVWGLPDERGFIVYSPNFTLNWVLRDYPLVTNVTTYWYGAYGDLASNTYEQVLEPDLNDTDSSQVFSWQNISVPADEVLTRAVIVKFGNFESATPILTLSFTGIDSSPLYYRTVITAIGQFTEVLTNLSLVVDDDLTKLIVVDTTFDSNGTVAFNFTIEQLGIGQGPHTFSFYAIDPDGNVAPPVTFNATVVAPTATRSHTPTNTFSPSPHATQTPAPANIRIDVQSTRMSFDILGYNGTEVIQSSYFGYSVLFRPNGTDGAELRYGEPATIADVTLSFHPTVISENAVLLAFKLRNGGPFQSIVDIAISSDVYFDENDAAVVTEIEPGLGFVISSSENALSFVLRNSLLVTDVSTFWYGLNVLRPFNLWTQTAENCANVADSAVAFSWQEISLRPDQVVHGSVIAKFGVHAPKHLSLSLAFPSLSELPYRQTVVITGEVAAADPSDNVTFLLVVDDPTTAFRISDERGVNQPISFEFRAADYAIGGGAHQLSFYAIDAAGNPSTMVPWIVTVLAPTATPTASISASQSPTASPSPRPNVPILLTADVEFGSFNLVGVFGDRYIYTSWSGYYAILRIGDEARSAGREPAALFNVFMSVSWRSVSANAVVLTLEVNNRNSTVAIVDIGVTNDINFDGSDDAPVTAIPGRRGLTVHSETNALTFITGGYPLVTNVSTFWFGYYWNMSDFGWTQVSENAFSGWDSAMTFTWQNVSVAGGAVVRKSVIVRFGNFETNHIMLTMGAADVVVYVGKTLTVAGSVNGSGISTSPAVRLFVEVSGEGELREVEGEFVIGQQFREELVIEEYGLGLGVYALTFYAVDADGDVSEGWAVTVRVIEEPTRSGGVVEPTKWSVSQEEPSKSSGGEETAESGGSTVTIVVISVIGGIGLIVGVFFLVRSLRNRRRHLVDEKLTDQWDGTTEGMNAFMDDELLPD